MNRSWIALLMCVAPLAGWNQEREVNVNSRYTVESVELSGAKETRLSRELRDELQRKIGQKYDQCSFETLKKRIREELSARAVMVKLRRGAGPDSLKVVFEVVYRKARELELRYSKLAYQSKEGWTGDLTIEGAGVILGLVSNGDDLLERFAGLRAGFRHRLFTDRLQFRFLYETFHQQWNRATLRALDPPLETPGVYRTRENFQPEFTLVLARGVTLTPGLSFQRLEMQFPAARTESANAVTTTLRFRRQATDKFANTHRVDAGYSLRAATRSLDSDFTYTRHRGDAQYRFTRRDETLVLGAGAGRMSGRAPLFERFSLGNSTTLRGWNKFDVAPLGGSRMAHGSAEYLHAFDHHTAFAVFYDAGAVWERSTPAVARHSVGAGLRFPKEGFYFYVGFPVRSGRAEPIFMAGVNF